jgi:hypothetical protein
VTTTTPAESAPARSGAVVRLRRGLTVVLGPLWVRTFRDPVRDGHLRLDSLSRSEKQLARFGLVMLGFLLGSVLFSEAWRAGTLYQLTGENELRFLPIAALPVTLLGFFLSWALICWGALDASPAIRLLVAVLFLASGSALAVSGIALGLGPWILEHGGTLMRAGFFATAGVLVLSALLHPWVRSRPRAARAVTTVLRAVVLVSLLLQFGVMLWVHVQAERSGFPTPMPAVLDGSIGQINSFLLPLVYVAAIAVIDFALDVSTSLTEPVRVLSRRWVFAVLLAVLALKIVVQVVLEWDRWTTALTYQPVAFVRTAVSIAFLVVLVAVTTRFAASDDYALAKERSMYGSSFVLAAPYLLSVFGVGVSLFLVGQFNTEIGIDVNDAIPYGWLGTEGLAIVAAAAVALGMWLMRRSRGGYGDELGSAMIVVGGWCLLQLTLAAFDLELGFSYPTVDAVVTAGVLVLMLVRGRSLSTGALVALTTLLVFSWLVVSRGDYLSFVGGLVGLPGILVVVFGVVLTLATGSSFASRGSRRLPSEARPLLFVGYLLLSVVILFWIQVTHEPGQDQDSLAAFYFIGIPMAAWLVGRRIATRPETEVDPAVKVRPPPSSDARPAPLPRRP